MRLQPEKSNAPARASAAKTGTPNRRGAGTGSNLERVNTAGIYCEDSTDRGQGSGVRDQNTQRSRDRLAADLGTLAESGTGRVSLQVSSLRSLTSDLWSLGSAIADA